MLKDRAQTHHSTNDALGCWDRIRGMHRTSPPLGNIHCHRCRSTSPRIYLAQDVARSWRALIFSSRGAASKYEQKKKHDGGESEEKMMKAEPSEIKIESATAIRPILISRYCHPTFDRFGAPRSEQRHRSNQKKIDFGRQRKNQRRASKHVLGPRKSRSISVRKHGANAV